MLCCWSKKGDIMDKYFDIKNKVLEYANNDENIKAIIAIGSSTRAYMKADEFSDLDLFIITSNTEEWFCGDYPKLLGTINISFKYTIIKQAPCHAIVSKESLTLWGPNEIQIFSTHI